MASTGSVDGWPLGPTELGEAGLRVLLRLPTQASSSYTELKSSCARHDVRIRGGAARSAMVSVGTQTPWSWLSGSPATTGGNENGKGRDECARSVAVAEPAEYSLPPVHEAASTPANDELGGDLHLPSVVPIPGAKQAGEEAHVVKEELSLPLVVAQYSTASIIEGLGELAKTCHEPEPTSTITGREGEEGIKREERVGQEEASIPALVGRLSELEFPSGSSSDSHTSEEEEDNDNMYDGLTPDPQPKKLPPYPEVPTGQLSWPAILQYLRESESEAGRYFSLNRSREMEKECRVEEREPLVEDRVRGISTGQEELARGSTTDGGDRAQLLDDHSPAVEKMSRECDFCGQSAPQWSVLHATTGAGESTPEACCCQFKEYCVLVAACFQQMIAERASQQPARISVRLKHRKDVKKTAEEKALALYETIIKMKRRKRWEQKLKKNQTLQSSSFYSLTKQTKTIQFSLVSPAALSTGWMVGERQRGGGGRKKKEKTKGRRKRGGGEIQAGRLPADILEMLRKTRLPSRALEVRTYHSNTRSFCTLLPDNTGQYYYPSGTVAVLIYSHIPGVLSYLFFNDTRGPGGGSDLLCYADELGRAFCYYLDSSLRLQFSVCGEGVIYSIRGGVKRRWRWGGAVEGEDSAFQPLSLSLNKQLSLQCSGRDQLLVTFSVSQQYVKFTIPRKLKDTPVPEDIPTLNETESYLHHLSYVQTRVEYLLGALGGPRGRSRKLSELQAVRGLRTSSITHQKPRPRSRSTGALNSTTPTYSTTSRRLV